MNELLVVFSHGKESGPLGSKIRALIQVAERLGAWAISVNYREHPDGTAIDPDAPGEADRRVAQLFLATEAFSTRHTTRSISFLKPPGKHGHNIQLCQRTKPS